MPAPASKARCLETLAWVAATAVNNLVHRARLAAHGLQNPQAHRFAQQAEAQGNLLQLVFGQQMVGLSG